MIIIISLKNTLYNWFLCGYPKQSPYRPTVFDYMLEIATINQNKDIIFFLFKKIF